MSDSPPPNVKADINTRWIQQLRRNNKITASWSCILCPERRIFASSHVLWEHAQSDHHQSLPSGNNALQKYREEYEAECAQKTSRVTKDNSQRKPNMNEANKARPEPPPSKRPHSRPTRVATTRSTSGLGQLKLENITESSDIDMREVSDTQPRKRAAIGDGISAGSASPFKDSSASPPPRRSRARPTSAPYSERESLHAIQRPAGPKKQLWTDNDVPLTRSSINPSNIASVQMARNSSQSESTISSKISSNSRSPTSSVRSAPPQNLFSSASDDSNDIILQPETRPISQEQLVAEVKGIYAGLVMVEAKCIEVDNKQATLAQADADSTSSPALNNEQWQALIALRRTLLHEHHDFLLASQHPSASPALRRLASKYAMPAKMWRHSIHSFLELLRHKLPASLDHMLAFIYLAYSMMALLYETVPAFKDTWIECLGDLGRYRMAIEDDDIRDREVWTGVVRDWYSKASDKAPTTGRIYHHLAILARPDALGQLSLYSRALCTSCSYTSAHRRIFRLLDSALRNDEGPRLPHDIKFVKARGILFTRTNTTGNTSIQTIDLLKLVPSPQNALEFGIRRIGDPNVLPFLHVILELMLDMTHGNAANVFQEDFPWDLIALMLNTLVSQYHTPDRIKAEQFSFPETDDLRPFPEDFALRGLIWADDYFPADWFAKEHIDEDRWYLENISMADPEIDVLANRSAPENPPESYIEPFLLRARKAYKYLAEIVSLLENMNASSCIPESSTLRLLYRRAQRSIRRSLRQNQKFLVGMVLLRQMNGVTALPTGNTPTEEVSSVLETALLAVTLGGILACIMKFKNWRDTSHLLIPAILVNVSCYAIGTDNRISDADLVVCWLYTAGMNIALVKDKLRRQGRAGGLVALCIALLGILSAIALASSLSFPEGERYSNPSISIVMALLPATLLWEGSFLAVLQCLGPESEDQVTGEAQLHGYPQGERSRSPVRRNQLDVARNNDYRFQPRNTM